MRPLIFAPGLAAACIAQGAWAQAISRPTEFPTDAVPLTAEAFDRDVAGKTWYYSGGRTVWRWTFQRDGGLFVAHDGTAGMKKAATPGRWRMEEGRLCREVHWEVPRCDDARIADGKLLLQAGAGRPVLSMAAQ